MSNLVSGIGVGDGVGSGVAVGVGETLGVGVGVTSSVGVSTGAATTFALYHEENDAQQVVSGLDKP